VLCTTLAGQLIVGGVLSTTVTVAVHWLLLPLASVTVSVTVFGPLLAQVKVLGLTVSESIPQLSLLPLSTSAPVIEALPLASNAFEMSLHTAVGGIASVTVNVVSHVVVLLLESLTVRVIVVVPVPTIVPTAGFCVITNKSVGVQLSVAITSFATFGTEP